jgi:hypothetical protein
MFGESFRRLGSIPLADLRKNWDEGGVEGALRKDGTEMIGQPQCDEESVGDRPGAKHISQHDVASKAGDSRQQREAAYRENASQHRLALIPNPQRQNRLGW